MNLIAMHIVSGSSFFSGIFLILLSIGLSLGKWSMDESVKCGYLLPKSEAEESFFKRISWPAVCRTSMRLAFILGMMLVFLSSTPQPVLLEALFYLVPAAFMASLYFGSVPRRTIHLLATASAAVCILALVLEIPFHIVPPIARNNFEKVYVVGDSVSAGIAFKGEKTWTEIAAANLNVSIANLSQGGGTTRSAISQTKLIRDEKALVFIEIGGNDMLGRTPLAEYQVDLEKLLSSIRAPDRMIVMMEIPWAPFHGGYCRAQRELARKYGTILIPRRIFTGVISGRESTEDGIHLSNIGHEKMAEAFSRICGPALKDKSKP